MNKVFWFISVFVLFLPNVWAAPCCGTTANNPSLITGDDRFQITSTLSAGQVLAEVSVDGKIKYRPSSDSEQSQSLRLDLASLISDRIQMGLTLPLIRRTRSRSANSVDAMGLGDISLSLSYEALPEWSYSLWRPKLFLFVTGTVPTGGSIYDAEKLYSIDSRGRGFYGASIGALLLKAWGNVDVSFLVEGHQLFSKEKATNLGSLRFSPDLGNSQTLASGWSPGGGNFRLGLALSRSDEGAVKSSGVFEGRGEPTQLWTASTQLGYLVNSETSLNLNFSDQTWIGKSSNTALARSVAIVFQQRWER